MRNKGFTIIELLTVSAIIIFLTGLIVANFSTSRESYALKRASHQLTRDLRRAEELAMSAKEFNGSVPKGYGIYFKLAEPSHYILFADISNPANYQYDSSAELAEDVKLEAGVKITALFSFPALTVFFRPPDPMVIITPLLSQAEITLNGVKTVTINQAGLIQ